ARAPVGEFGSSEGEKLAVAAKRTNISGNVVDRVVELVSNAVDQNRDRRHSLVTHEIGLCGLECLQRRGELRGSRAKVGVDLLQELGFPQHANQLVEAPGD